MQTIHKNEKQTIYLQNEHKKVDHVQLHWPSPSALKYLTEMTSNMEISSKYRLRLQKDRW